MADVEARTLSEQWRDRVPIGRVVDRRLEPPIDAHGQAVDVTVYFDTRPWTFTAQWGGQAARYQLDGEVWRVTERDVVDIAGGGFTDPGDTELDDAVEQIVGDYIPDTLLRLQCAGRIMREVTRRTGLDVYARPTSVR
jgi:hypothetical protein